MHPPECEPRDNAHALIANGTSESQTGGTLATSGTWSYGALAVNNGTVTLNNVTVTTTGCRGFGLEAAVGGADASTINAINTNVTTHSYSAHAVQAFDGDNVINLEGGSLTTMRENSYGMQARGGGIINADGVKIVTNSINGFAPGAYIFNGSTINLTGGTSITVQTTEDIGANFFTAGAVITDGILNVENSSINAKNAPAILVRDKGIVNVTGGTLIAGRAALKVVFTDAPDVVAINLGAGTRAVQNNGTLLQVHRFNDGMEGVVDLTLKAGSVSRGDIVDLDANGAAAGTDVLIEKGAVWTGRTFGVRNFESKQSGDVTFANGSVIAGNITGNGSSYTFGAATTIAGNVVLNASATKGGTAANPVTVNGSVTVDPASVFGGIWNIGGDLDNSGTVSPGNSIGTVNVAGNLTLAPSSVYAVEVDAVGNSDRIVVGGTATVDGAVTVTPLDGFLVNTPYTILTAGTVNGTFDSATMESAFLSPQLSYPGGSVLLTLVQTTSFESVGGTPNQQAVGGALDENNPAPALYALNSDQARTAFDALSGVQHTHAQYVAQTIGETFQSLLLNPDAPVDRKGSVWFGGMGSFGDIEDTANATGADFHFGGGAIGGEWALTGNTVFGIAGGAGQADISVVAGTLDATTFDLALYSQWRRDNGYFNLSAGGGYYDFEAERSVLTEPADTDYDSYAFRAGFEGGKSFGAFTPFIRLTYGRLWREEFSENGSFGLSVDKETHDSVRGQLGVRYTTGPFSLDAAYVNEFADREVGLTGSLDGTNRFSVSGPRLDRDRLRFGAAYVRQMSASDHIAVRYTGELAGSHAVHGFSATYRRSW